MCTPLTHTEAFTLRWCIDMLTSMSYPHCPHSSISLLHYLSHTHTHARLTVHSNRTVVLHLSMLFMRKWRSGPWMMSSFLWVAWPTPPGKPASLFMQKKKKVNIQITFKKNIRGTKLRTNHSKCWVSALDENSAFSSYFPALSRIGDSDLLFFLTMKDKSRSAGLKFHLSHLYWKLNAGSAMNHFLTTKD